MTRPCLIFILIFLATDLQADNTARIVREHVRGNRVQFFDNPIAPEDQNRKTIITDDAISGARLEITYAASTSDAVLIVTGNVNVGGRVKSTPLTKVQSNDLVSFVGVDPEDGALYLLSYHSKLKKLLWSAHNDRISFVDGGVVGKLFIAECK